MRRTFSVVLAFVVLLAAGSSVVRAAEPLVPETLWAAYKAKFMDDSGRIIDNANGNISHSEGQGYGLLLAYLADNRQDFEQIWYFTRTELLVRDDGLAAWKWEPQASPHVTDVNNATDGDILIAYALALAGSRWSNAGYLRQAAMLARAILQHTVVTTKGRTLLLPAAEGFAVDDRADGPVINPSYWVFEALPIMGLLAPSPKWEALSGEGLGLLKRIQFGPKHLPAEWISLSTQPKPADGFEQEYGYNALRIPLYLMRGGVTDKDLLRRLREGWLQSDGVSGGIIDLPSGRTKAVLDDPGYQIINHIAACISDGKRITPDVRRFNPVLYFPSTLQLLGLAFVTEKHPECL
ncbi:glycosyl hydrolase family 8 [Rhizobium oryzicola]|uniref:cellulase n=1 Tax=Rhizobium oryzicola TaxID=1232668 RepID=A0ABT8T350_9HYPH|nr:glycosyl hydrolase family 8 [Rhizobium oryzicola]MDO1585072.1 glycosyl hydrolase family 8 [Rhizobium oryzicola]